MRARRAAACLLAAAGVAAGATVATGHQPPGPERPCPGGTDAVLNDRAWSLIKMPDGLERITSHAAGGLDGKLVLATDGRKLRRSDDGGCTWQEGYAIETPDVDQAPRIHMVTFVGDRAFMLVSGLGGEAGSRLLRSDDGGATFTAAGEGLPPVGGFRDIQGGGDRLYVVVSPRDEIANADAQGITGELYASEDGGTTFVARGRDQPIAGLAVDPTDSRRLYAVRATGEVERSEDGGMSFAALPVTPADVPGLEGTLEDPASLLSGGAKWRRIAVGRLPGQPASLMLVASRTAISEPTRVVFSKDDGKTFLDLPAAGLGPVSGMTFGNAARQVLVTSGSDSTAQKGPGAQIYDVRSQAFRDVDDEEHLSLFEPHLVSLSPGVRGHEGLVGVQLRRHFTGDGGKTPDAIARYILPDPPPEFDPQSRDRCLEQVAQGKEQPEGPPGVLERKVPPVEWDPGLLSLRLEPGKPLRTPLKARLAPVPTALDIAFLVDNSTSQQSTLTGILCSVDQLALSLPGRGVDARFGLATYSHRDSNRYTRHLDLTSSATALRNALAEIKTKGGDEEPMRSGLFQLATGEGLDFVDSSPRPGNTADFSPRVTVPPGQQMNYDPDRLHVAMVVADQAYGETTPREPTPEQVSGALNAKQIRTIGVQILADVFNISTASENALAADRLRLREQLERFARDTGTLAPPGGVDCDGEGQPDVAEGQPLVCSVRETGVEETIGDTIVTLLRTFKERKDVRIVASRTSNLSVTMEGNELKDVNVRSDSQIASAAIVSCTAEQAGRRYPLEFDVLVGGKRIGSLPGAATCGTIAAAAATARPARAAPAPEQAPDSPRESPAPVKKAPPVKSPAPNSANPAPAPSAQPTPQSAVAIAPPPPPPSPVPISSGATSTAVSASSSAASASASASAPAASPAGSPAVGMAAAEERAKAAQVATVKADGGEYAMVAVRENARERSSLPAPAAITLGAGFVGAAGWLLAGAGRRRRRSPVAARVRR